MAVAELTSSYFILKDVAGPHMPTANRRPDKIGNLTSLQAVFSSGTSTDFRGLV